MRADPLERSLADDLWLTMGAVERLVGDGDERRDTLCEACQLMRRQLTKRGQVGFIVRTQHRRYDNHAILDVLADGREAELIDDLITGRLDLTDESQFGMWIGGATDFDDR